MFAAVFQKYRLNIVKHMNILTNNAETASASSSNAEEKLGAVCPGQWHRLSVRLSARSSVLQLDDQTAELRSVRFLPAALDELRALPVHIGGTTGDFFVVEKKIKEYHKE